MKILLPSSVAILVGFIGLANADVISQWSFEDDLADSASAGTSDDTLTDNSSGLTYVPGIVGKAVNLPDGKLTAPDSDDVRLGANWSLEAFVWRSAANLDANEWERFWSKWGEESEDFLWSFRGAGNQAMPNAHDLLINGNQVIGHETVATSMPTESWAHVALVGDQAANTVRAYLNGAQVGEGPYEPIAPGANPMNFGNFGASTPEGQFSGRIDEALIHDIAVSAKYVRSRAGLLLPDPDGDPDMDGLTNLDELILNTDPEDPDTDGDGYPDGVETGSGVWNGPSDPGTSPTLADTDGDGLGDKVENPDLPYDGAEQPGTDPNIPDSDGDEARDGDEIAAGTDPTDPESTPAVVVARWSFEDNLEDSAPAGARNDALVDNSVGVTYVPGVVGLAVSMPRGKLTADSSSDLNLASDWTMEAFVYRATTNLGSNSTERFWSKWAEGSHEYLWNFEGASDASVPDGLDLHLNGRKVFDHDSTLESLPFEVWTHVALVANEAEGTIRAYINGIDVGGGSYLPVDAGDGSMNFGNFGTSDVKSQFTGIIDEAMIHRGAVSRAYLIDRAKLLCTEGVPNPDGDDDGDGLTNQRECEIRTDPNNPDTDGDGLGDAVETLTGIWNGTGDTGTNPRLADSDGDGIDDGAENPDLPSIDLNQPGTDPNHRDSDRDGIVDRVEVQEGTNPKDANDPSSTIVVSHWNFDNNLDDAASFGVASDDLAASLTGGVTYVPGIMGSAVYIPSTLSTANKLTAADSPDLNLEGDWTLEAFVWRDAENSPTHEIERFWVKWGEGGNEYHWVFRGTGAEPVPDGLDFFATGSEVFGHDSTSMGMPTEEWVHVALVADEYETNSIRGFINGVEVASAPYRKIPPTPGNMNFGNFGTVDQRRNQFSGYIDEALIHRGAVSDEYLFQRAIQVLGPPKPRITDISRESGTGDLRISWESLSGSFYTIRSSTDLGGDPAGWPIYGTFENIPATPPENSLTIPFPPDEERYFVVEGITDFSGTIFADDFESGEGDWTTGSEGAAGTSWQLGVPDGGGPGASNSGVNCFGTNLAGDYGGSAEVWLRSPRIDLTPAEEATLRFAQYRDIEFSFDRGVVNILDANDDSLIVTLLDPVDGASGTWESLDFALPPEAVGRAIKIEFRFLSDPSENFAGWYVDDVEITVP